MITQPKIEFITFQPHELEAFARRVADIAVKAYASTLPPTQDVFTKEEAAAYLRLLSANGKPNTQAIDRLRREGKLEAVEDAKTVRITRKALDKYLEEYKSVI